MKAIIKKYKVEMVFVALLCAALGIVLVAWPEATIDVLCKVLATAIIVIGIVQIISCVVNRAGYPVSAILGVIVLLVGIWIFLQPQKLVSLVPIVIGVILLVHGLQDLQMALETKRYGYTRWWIMAVIAVISVILGVVCVINAFGIVALTFRIIGIALIYDGVTDFWIALKAVWTQRVKEKEEAALESEYKEVK